MSDEFDHHDSDFASRRLVAARHPAELVFGVLAFAFALFLLVQVPSQTTWVEGAGLASQPALWPVVAVVGMTLFGAAELSFAWRRTRPSDRGRIRAEVIDWSRSLEYVLWFMGYVWLVPRLGYLPATLVFCVGLAFRLGYRCARMLIAAALVGAATVVVFKAFLNVRIPGGTVYEYLPPALRNFMILYL